MCVCVSVCLCVCVFVCLSVCLFVCLRPSSPDCPSLHPEDPLPPSAWRRPGAHWPEGLDPGWAGRPAGHPGWGSHDVGRWQLPGRCSPDSLQDQYCHGRNIWDIKWFNFKSQKWLKTAWQVKERSYRQLTCCAGPEGVSGGFHGCLPQMHWGVCDRRRPASQCGRWAHPAGWARSGLSPQRSAAFLTTPPPWPSRGRWTTDASKCTPCLAGLGYQSPVEEQARVLAGDETRGIFLKQGHYSPEWPDWGPAAPAPASLTASWGTAWQWPSAAWAEPIKLGQFYFICQSWLVFIVANTVKYLFYPQ